MLQSPVIFTEGRFQLSPKQKYHKEKVMVFLISSFRSVTSFVDQLLDSYHYLTCGEHGSRERKDGDFGCTLTSYTLQLT